MKRFIALFLVLIMLLSLCACGSLEKKVVGTWGYDGYIYLELMKDGKGLSPDNGPLLWELYDDSLVITWLKSGKIVEFKYDSETDMIKTSGGSSFRRIK